MPSCQATLPLHQSPCPKSPVPRACGGHALYARALHPEVPYMQDGGHALFARALVKEHQTDCDMKETPTPNKRQKTLTKWLKALNFNSRRANEKRKRQKRQKRERGKREKEAKEAKEAMQRQRCYALSTLLQYEAVRQRTGAGACSSEGEATACRPKSAAVHTDICLG